MIIDGTATLTGLMNWTGGAALNSENLNLIASRPSQPLMPGIGISASRCRCPTRSEKIGAAGPRWPTSNRNYRRDETGPRQPARRARRSRPVECFLEGIQPPQIVGQLENPLLEAIRRLWWRAFDSVCDWTVLARLSIHDRIYGPEPPTRADLICEYDHERLVRAFPVVDERIG